MVGDGFERVVEIERRAAPAVAGGPNPTVLRFDDRLTDSQAHAAALQLRRRRISRSGTATCQEIS